MGDGLTPLEFLIGEWDGHETGAAGIGVGDRSYRRAIGGKFIEVRSTSTFEPQEANPEGEVHEEMGMFSFDGSTIRLREFHAEGFVIRYTLIDSDDGLVFLSDDIESGPPGLRARLTLRPAGDAEFEEHFELSSDGESFQPFIRNHWTRRGTSE